MHSVPSTLERTVDSGRFVVGTDCGGVSALVRGPGDRGEKGKGLGNRAAHVLIWALVGVKHIYQYPSTNSPGPFGALGRRPQITPVFGDPT